MDRIGQYMDVVPLPAVILGALLAIGAFLMIPADKRLPVALFILPIWLTIGRMPQLPIIQAVAKMSGAAAFGLVLLAALLDPGRRRQLAAASWIWPAMAVVSFGYVLTVVDRDLALVLRVQWLMLVLAALAVARVMADAESTKMVIYSIAAGCIIGVLLPFSHLILNPREAFAQGMGRIFPWGANPNQIGPLFALAAPLTLYLALRARTTAMRFLLLGWTCIPIGMGVLTGSRGTVLVIGGALIPLILTMTKRPVLTIVGGLIAVGGFFAVLSAAESKDLSRLGSLETERFLIFGQYAAIIAERPLFGLLGTQGESWQAADAIRTNSHNVYLHTLYLGGLSYFVPMAIVVIASVRAAFRVWVRRTLHDVDPLLTSVLVAYMGMLLFHGCVGVMLSFPTYAASFMFVLLSMHFLTTARGMTNGEFLLSRYEAEDWAYEDEYEYDDAEYEPA